MNLQITCLPNDFYNPDPAPGGFFPFAIEGNPKYIFNIENIDHGPIQNWDENFLPLWMEKIAAFPIYFCAEFSSSWREEFEETCRDLHLDFTDLVNHPRFHATITKVENVAQLRGILPVFIQLGYCNFPVLWSTNQNVFRIEERKWKLVETRKKKEHVTEFVRKTIVVNMENNTSAFWIGYDGDFLMVISNQECFSTFENLCNTLPGSV